MRFKPEGIKYLIQLFVVLDVIRVYREMHFIYYITQALLLIFILIALNDYFLSRSIGFEKKILLLLSLFFLYPIYSTLTWAWSVYPVSSLLKGFNTIFVTAGILSIVILWSNYVKESYFLIVLPAFILLIASNLVSLVSGFPGDAWTIGHGLGFAGLFGHQNALATTILFTLPALFYFLDQKLQGKKHKFLFYSLAVLSLLLISLSYSRACLFVIFCSVIIFLVLTRSVKYLAVIGSVIGVVFLLMLLIPKVNEVVFYLAEKQSGSIFANRTVLWNSSFEAAKEGAFWGLGLGVGDLNKYYSELPQMKEGERFYREKGNMFLALIEETGVLGFILFLIPVIIVLKRLREKPIIYEKLILFCAIIACLLQCQFEAWNGAGNTLMQFFLLYNFMGFFAGTSN